MKGFGVIEIILLGFASGILTYGAIRGIEALEEDEQHVIGEIEVREKERWINM